MSTTDKTAGIFGPSAEQLAQQEAALNKFYGGKMISSLGAGAGIGLGATAIYQLLRSLKRPGKKEKKYTGYGSGSPVPAKMAGLYSGTGGMMQQMSTGSGSDPSAGSRPFLNSMAPVGGRLPLNIDPQRVQDMWSQHFQKYGPGGQQPGMLGAGSGIAPQQQANPGSNPLLMKNSFDLSKLQETLGGMLPKTMIPFSLPSAAGFPAPSSDPHAWRKAWGTAANLGAGALGLYGGKKVVDSVVQAKKKRDLEAEMEAARQDYYSALAGDKSASALDFAFETVKHANVLDTISGVGSAVVNTPQALRTAYLLAMLGAGGVGAKYMYDKTKETTEGENLAKAQASRARTKGLPPVWVDPQSLAHVKSFAGSHE